MVGSKAEKDHSRRVGKNWVIIGFCTTEQTGIEMLYQELYGNEKDASTDHKPFTKITIIKHNSQYRRELTFRYSTGLVTLNLSMVEIIMAGVVRKKRRRKRMQLMTKQRTHHENPPTDRCSLWDKVYVAVRPTLSDDPQLWTQLASKLIL